MVGRSTLRGLAVGMVASAASIAPAQAMDGVVASIKPVHSIVAVVMGDTGTPGLIVEGAGSPHTYSLKPSQAAMLQDAKLVFWVGPMLESFLEGPLETLAGDANAYSLMKAEGLHFVALREGGAFEEHDHDDGHDHDDHDHDAKDDHGHEGHGHGSEAHDHDHDDGKEPAEHDHDHEEGHKDEGHDHAHDGHGEHAKHDDGHDDHAGHEHGEHEGHGDGHEGHEHAHGEVDAHIWLDPRNASAMAHAIAHELAEMDPDNAATYEANADAFEVQMARLEDELEAVVEPVREKGFIVFHDAYHMFEDRFGLEASGSITISPEARPGAERIAELREKVASAGVACVFAEPQFEPKIVQTVVEGTEAQIGILDPLGSELEVGASLYPALLRNMAAEFRRCLAG